jgi:hypothetical protein
MPMRKDTGDVTTQKKGRGRPILHGTLRAYKKHGCRCEACRETLNAYSRLLSREKNGHERMVEFAEYSPYLLKHLDRGVPQATLSVLLGMSEDFVHRTMNTKGKIRMRTFRLIKTLPENIPARKVTRGLGHRLRKMKGKERQTAVLLDICPEEMEQLRKKRFEGIFYYLYRGGFDQASLAERLGVSRDELDRFRWGGYEDNRLSMRICRLHHVMRMGE